jgi:hypothetical protein
MALVSIVSGDARGQPAGRGRGAEPLADRTWSSHATCAIRRRQHWQVTRRVPLREMARTQTAAVEFLNSLEEDFASSPRLSNGLTDWAMVASIPSTSPNGFDIDIRADESGISASFGGLNHEFDLISSAMVWVRRALSRQYQLRIVCFGGLAREWYLEPVGRDQQTHQGNSLDSSKSLAAGHPVLMRRWRKTSVNYRRNRLLDLAGPGIVGH